METSPIRVNPETGLPLTPRYLVSPGTVEFLERRCREGSPITPPTVPRLPEVQSPDLRQFSPDTEEFIFGRYLELFGMTPTKDLLSPLSDTPPAVPLFKVPAPPPYSTGQNGRRRRPSFLRNKNRPFMTDPATGERINAHQAIERGLLNMEEHRRRRAERESASGGT